MVDVLLNSVTVLVWASAGLLYAARRMERGGLLYSIQQLENGVEFWYRLGVYSGTIKLMRTEDAYSPTVMHRTMGWDVYFPLDYTNGEMCQYIKEFIPHQVKKGSHSMDLLVFDQIVNCRNDCLECYLASIFVIKEPVRPL